MTATERLHSQGIRRLGTVKRGFKYRRADGKKLNADDAARIQQLKIPPAWTDVAISASPNAKIQVVGKDLAGRWQYLYHSSHERAREAKKFKRLIKFAEALPQLRTVVNRDLAQEGLGREKVLASILRILESCFMRSGSQVYANENGSYGIATLRPKHVKVNGGVVEFDFPGKSGVRQQREIKDRKVAKVVKRLLEHPGAEVFKFQNGEGQFVDVKSRHINEYIRETMGEGFSAKDFRTWAGTLVCACALARAGIEPDETRTSLKKKIVLAVKETAETLGNTPAVCRSSYICPGIIASFEHGRFINNYFKTLEKLIAYRGRKLHPAESSLLRFLKKSATNGAFRS
jgi:DNA topoisomerase-1